MTQKTNALNKETADDAAHETTQAAAQAKVQKVAPPASFEAAMRELAELVARMEAGELALDASVTAYARGSALVQYCAAQLEKVEQQVRILDEEMLKPFQTESTDGNA